MHRLRSFTTLAAVVCLTCLLAAPALGQLPAEKQAELRAAGITDWTPGQNRAAGAKFSTLANPRPAPAGPVRDTATMQYDDGSLSALPTSFGLIFGNRFSLGVSSVALSTITLNSFSFYFMEDSLPDTGLFFQPADPLNATSISARASVNIGGLANSGPSFSSPVLNTINQTALATAGVFSNTFFLGAWCLNSATTFPVDNETIGLSTNDAPGARAFAGYTASSGTGPVAFAAGAFNAILRANVTSPNTVPVELMSFGVDGE